MNAILTNQQKFDMHMLEAENSISYAYPDSLGYWTIGIGRCIDKRINTRALSQDEIYYLYQNDMKKCRQELSSYAWYKNQDEVRQDVLVELCFNLGMPHLLGFKNMLQAILKKDYVNAGKHLLNSKWAAQVKTTRATHVHYRLVYGRYP